RIYKTNPIKENGPLFIMHHGAGSSALTFGFTAKYIKELSNGQCGVMAVDCRGHGATNTENNTDFSLECLSDDLIHIIQATVKETQDIILVGHR
ncbi:uncharacterized protein EV154DRAFT_429249, partial [Mucor mucedo]|uniref:uncharacterized protein n=1 Tax=Mucor mucedo TaxID=29922 RepID=UPI00221F3361